MAQCVRRRVPAQIPSTHIKTDRHTPVTSTLERKSRSVLFAQKLGWKVIEEDI